MRTHRLHTLIIAAGLVASGMTVSACSKSSKPKVHGSPSSPAGGTTGSTTRNEDEPDEPAGTEGVQPGEAPVTPSEDPRIKAMNDAYQALVRADDTAVPTVIALGEDTRSVLVRAIESENIRGTTSALKALVKLGETDKEVERLLRIALDNTADSVRIDALDAAASLKVTALRADAARMLADEELTVRATACDALATLGPEAAHVEKMFAAVQDAEDVVRAACSGAFATVASRDEWRPAVAKLLLGNDVAAKEGALRVLGEWLDPTSFDLISGRLADESPVVVAIALSSLSRFGDTATTKEIERFLKDERLSVRVEAVAALAHLPADQVRHLAYEALRDRESVVRVEAATLLSRFDGDPETWIRLHALLRDEDDGVRSAAVLALNDLADPRSRRPLAERLAIEEEAAVRAEIVEALVTAAGKDAIPHLIDRLDVAKGPEATAALIGLRTLTEQRFPPKRDVWQKWYKEQSGATPEAPESDGTSSPEAPSEPEP